jgi:hypothetical protein
MQDVRPDFYTVQQVAAALQLPESWVYSECRRYIASKGKRGIPCRKFGRYTRIFASTVEDLKRL